MNPEVESIHRLAEEFDTIGDAFSVESEYESPFDEDDDSRGRPMRPAPRFRPSSPVGGARVGAGGGSMQVRFPQPVASAQGVEQLKQDTQRAIADVRADIGRLRTETNGKIKAVNDRIGTIQQGSLLTTLLPLLQGQPKIKSISFPTAPLPNVPITPTGVEYEKQDMMMLMLPLLMGGLGGSTPMGQTGQSGQGGGMNDMMLLMVAMMASKR